MKAITKGALSLAVVGILASPLASAANAEGESGPLGGWVEGEGNWSVIDTVDDGMVSVMKKGDKPNSHSGWINERNGKYQAAGTTSWPNKRHYTRAQLYKSGWPFGADTVYADSKRQWGTGSTEARSPWLTKKKNKPRKSARTYWGT